MFRKKTIRRANLEIQVPDCQGILDNAEAGKFIGENLNEIFADYLDGDISKKQATEQVEQMFEEAIKIGCTCKNRDRH